MSSINHDDFERLQASLIELKNHNYTLEEKCRKQKSALGEATARATVLDQELAKAQKVIQKSKKVSEVEKLVKENESLQRKLVSQEDDFRIQNQTLLDELSKLVSVNERLETKIRSTQKEGDSAKTHSSESDIEVTRLRQEVSSLKSDLANVIGEKESLESCLETLQSQVSCSTGALDNSAEINSSAVATVADGGEGVVFRKQSLNNNPGDQFNESQTAKKLRDEVSKVTDENLLFKEENRNFQEQISQLQEKLKKKQESFLAIQQEKEKLYKEFSRERDDQRISYENDSAILREQVNRLQVQLNHGHTGFAEFKERKAVEIEALQSQIQDLKQQNEICSPQRQSELSAQIICQTEELNGLKCRTSEVSQERDKLVAEVSYLKSELEKVTTENCELSKSLQTSQESFALAAKTSENRKSLLDEMAITLQTKSKEADTIIQNIEKELKEKTDDLQEKENEVEYLNQKVQSLNEELSKTQSELKDAIEQGSKLKKELAAQQVESEKKIREMAETHEEDWNVFKMESEIKIRDLTTQLEIANAQRSEFEEQVVQLQQDIQDLGEERKIVEKKNQGLVKDLKRQLLAEQQRNEKLSEKMKELLADPPSLSEPDRPNEIETDRTSNSSWSIYSGNNDLPRDPNCSSTPLPRPKSGSNESLSVQNVHECSPVRDSPVEQVAFTNDDYRALLNKIGSLQEANSLLQQRVQMLEHSSGAMAEDLLRKSRIIQFYCMEGKAIVRNSSQSSSNQHPAIDKLNMKKMMDLLVNPNDSQKEEMQRMQRMLEETLTKNMFLQKDLENLSQEVVRLSKMSISNSENKT